MWLSVTHAETRSAPPGGVPDGALLGGANGQWTRRRNSGISSGSESGACPLTGPTWRTTTRGPPSAVGRRHRVHRVDGVGDRRFGGTVLALTFPVHRLRAGLDLRAVCSGVAVAVATAAGRRWCGRAR